MSTHAIFHRGQMFGGGGGGGISGSPSPESAAMLGIFYWVGVNEKYTIQ